jgi:hypothetical protein
MKAYFTSLPLRSTRSVGGAATGSPAAHLTFSQDVALHLYSRQFGPQAADLHLLGAHDLAVGAAELAGTVRLDPVEQRLVHHAQRARRRRDALATLDKACRLLLELQRVARLDDVFVVSVRLAWIESLSKGCVFRGQGQKQKRPTG